jgi:hypothetical protein
VIKTGWGQDLGIVVEFVLVLETMGAMDDEDEHDDGEEKMRVLRSHPHLTIPDSPGTRITELPASGN